MKGGVILFRGTGADVRRYLESDRSLADDYYLEGGTALAEFSAVNAAGEVVGEVGLTPEEYASWVNWINPLTGESMGKPRLAGEAKQGSPRFAEMVVNAPKSLSVAAALHPEVSEALDAAQKDAVAEIRRWLGQHSVTRIGPRGKQEVVPVEQLETVSVVHHTSRAGDPHRHIHFQIGTRVWAADGWRGLHTAALFRQQGAIRALGTAVIAAHPQLAQALDAHGLTLDPVTGEVAELEPYNALMSKRSAQVQRNLARFEKDWRAAHPGEEPGPVVRGRLEAMAWDHERPSKKPTTLADEAHGASSWSRPATGRTRPGCAGAQRWRWTTSACNRSRRARWTVARPAHRPGRATRFRSTSRASSPRPGCVQPRRRCATWLRSPRDSRRRIACRCCRRTWCSPTMWRT